MQHFNELTPAQVELLALLAEECGECIQAIGKILRHGYYSRNPLVQAGRPGGESNLCALEKEMGDIRAAMTLLCNAGPASEGEVAAHAETKLGKIGRWLHHQDCALPHE